MGRSSRGPSVCGMDTKRILSFGLAVVTFLIAGPATSKPAGFSARVDNPWYPL